MSNLVERMARALSENCGSFTGDTADTLVRNIKNGEMVPRWRLFEDMATAAIAVVGAEVADLTKHNLALEDELHRVREMLRATSEQDEREASNKGRL